MSEARFIADSMLGSLARWLRILGFDTLYFRDIRDNELIRIAKGQERIIITRDTALSKSKRVERVILIESNDLKDQLKEFLRWMKGQGLKPCPFSLCPLCNGEVLPVDKTTIRNDVPDYIFLNVSTFYKCKQCGHVYWHGSHKMGIDRVIAETRD